MGKSLLGNTTPGSRRRAHARTTIGAVVATALLGLGACQDPNAGGAPTRHGEAGHGGHGEVKKLPKVDPRPSTLSVAAVLERAKEHFSALPEAVDSRTNPITEDKVTLGRMLYFDKRLSKNHDLSCASCHDLKGFGVDIREEAGKRAATSSGHKGAKGDRNAPTVYNAGLFLAQFWDGRAKDLEAQAKGPVTNPVEMAMADEAAVVNTLASIPGYVEAFAKAFPGDIDPVNYDNMAKAIGAFERQLMTPGPFDDFLSGKLTALSEEELRGLDLFMTVDCVQCHTGPAVGGTMYKKLGIVKEWEGLEDPGRGKLTKKADDEHVFKVPSLRNITQTGPYLHDGSIADLGTMVQKMATHQLAKGELSEDELSAMLAFLGSLEGRLPTEYIAEPTLPPSGPETPAADPT